MTDELVLDAVDQRVLGSLLEKQRTVPASYPMTLNALRGACNQTSSREPVVDYDEPMLLERMKSLKERGLVRIVWADRGPRTLKYHQLLDERLSLQPDERALLTVLLLRGPQAPGELKTRTERLHTFDDRSHVEAVLQRMADLPTPLVRQLERRPGQHDRRWVHLLGTVEVEQPAAAAAASAVDRESVLAEGAAARDAKVRAAYDVVAAAYADQLGEELARKPFDRWLLDRVASQARGPVADVGTGPGQVAAHLAAAGCEVTGIDLSPAMVEEASRRCPSLRFVVGSFTDLLRPPTAPGWGAITAWYALVHLASSELAPALAALSRVLTPGGWLALAVHAGGAVHHADELCGYPVDVDFVLHEPEQVVAAVGAAGLVDVEWYLRGPLAGEVETDRLYVLARRPDGSA